MIPTQLLSGSGSNVWTLTISADADNVNIKDELEALYGTMTTAVDAVVTIATGIKVGSTTTATAALRTGTSWPSGSKLKIVNYGKIRGKGGAGGGSDTGGSPGGDALDLGLNVTIDNTTVGNIFGGGGGGGGGNTAQPLGGGDSGGGGGGGGQGDDGGSGGTGTDMGENGQAGSESSYGNGGAGHLGVSGNEGGGGGRGGEWGSVGQYGGTAYLEPTPRPGGAGGKAIDKNGKTITWIAGYNSTQVKGAVS